MGEGLEAPGSRSLGRVHPTLMRHSNGPNSGEPGDPRGGQLRVAWRPWVAMKTMTTSHEQLAELNALLTKRPKATVHEPLVSHTVSQLETRRAALEEKCLADAKAEFEVAVTRAGRLLHPDDAREAAKYCATQRAAVTAGLSAEVNRRRDPRTIAHAVFAASKTDTSVTAMQEAAAWRSAAAVETAVADWQERASAVLALAQIGA